MRKRIQTLLLIVGLGMTNMYGAITTPTIQTPNITTVTIPSNTISSVTVTKTSIASVDVTSTEIRSVDIDIANIEEINVDTPTVTSPEKSLNELTTLYNKLNEMVQDKRAILYDDGVAAKTEALKKWIEIYQNHVNYVCDKNVLNISPKLIAEVRCPKDENETTTLMSNLEFYSKEGYTGVLFALRSNDTPIDILSTINIIKSFNLHIWFTLSGEESLQKTIFIDPDNIKQMFSVVAPVSEGMLLGWRKTSAHLFIMDRAYADYLASTAKSYNSDLYILGEGYFGETALTNGRNDILTYNMPEYVSGCLMVGLGYMGVNITSVVNNLYNKYDLPKVAVIVGEHPYYSSRNNNGYDDNKNLIIKHELEARFIKAGCIGTITLHGDGSDGVYGDTSFDNLCKNKK